jgi:type IV pilus assembly protein PilY1
MSFRSFSHYLWSGGTWLANASAAQKSGYDSTAAERYIFTQDSIAGGPIPFTPAALKSALTLPKYKGYLNASSEAEADNVVNWVRGTEIAGYRARIYDWGSGALVNKLGDIIGSTPTVVSKPAEDYDTVYRDDSYRLFRRAYDKRRIMVYTGANDGGLHAFNGGSYDRNIKTFLNAPSGKVAYGLGAEMWMFIPRNILPHLKWLTDPNYSHVYYVDLKPYVFDAKIFDPSDGVHTGGWGTVLVGGMGFGGGDMTVDTDGNGTRETTMRSSYFILDITNPETAPVLLAEFSDPGLGYSLAAPTAIPMLDCNRKVTGGCTGSWPMDWYLALPSGPHNDSATTPSGIQTSLNGKSDQPAQLYILKLGGTGAPNLPYASSGSTVSAPPAPAPGSPFSIPGGAGPSGAFPKSFLSDVIAVDYDLNFKTDVLYFGSVANTMSSPVSYKGGMHRLVTGESKNTLSWTLNTMLDVGKPVLAAPTAASDGSRIWVYFGTGRLLNAFEDKADTSQQTYFGLKESYDLDDKIKFSNPNLGNLVDVSKVGVENGTGDLYDTTTNTKATVVSTKGNTLAAKTFKGLNYEITEKFSGLDRYNGWKLDFSRSKERNLGQAALLGEVLTYTTYQPSLDVCSAEGESYLFALYYRTGTSFAGSGGQGIIGVTQNASTGGRRMNTRDTSLGAGMATTPNVSTIPPPEPKGPDTGPDGGGDTKAFIQTSTGAIITIDQKNPGTTTSGVVSWRDRDPE